ncbi:DUF1592 domain-containing protein [Planctellipticum variicoloris]|uniref:DUF1592 domain-containing protein n=1 Tax=Planctellipticum variicoloris TaxID=3064265 RepID=UPI0030134906|nr:DUF1592 domain-containing protein [Planctomycetaceae bacterium SH412]
MHHRLSTWAAVLLLNCASLAAAEPAAFTKLGVEYDQAALPLLKHYCLGCHSTEDQEGELDLERFARLSDVRKSPRVWQKVVEQLVTGEMPPKDSPQLSAEQKQQLLKWTRSYLDAEAHANAGDPGPVVLRRLSNVEYNNTIRDLTGVDLQPAREFPADSAAGEGFTNVGEALVMSPAMLDKYFAAARQIATHAVLLPDGFRFSPKATPRDWSDALIADIQQLYRQHSSAEGARAVHLHGLVWEADTGGRIPLEAYLKPLVADRDALIAGRKTVSAIADETQLSPKYLGLLWNLLQSREPSPLLDALRDRWRSAKPEDVSALATEIRQWQAALTKFNSVAHFKQWLEPVNPVAESQTFRIKLSPAPEAKEVVLSLAAGSAGEGSPDDRVEWQEPRLEAPGRPAILLKDIRAGLRQLAAKRDLLNVSADYLAAVDAARQSPTPLAAATLAEQRKLDPQLLTAWFDYLGVAGTPTLKVETLFTEKQEKSGDYDFVKSLGPAATPIISANSSDQQVRVPGIMKPHSVAVHPSPTENVAVGWRSPIAGRIRIETVVAHAHPECGNGVAWAIERRRGSERRRLAGGEIERSQAATIPPIDSVTVQAGDLISLLVGPRGTDHTCDLTEANLTLTELEGDKRQWSLWKDVSSDLLAANPHADSLGNREVWYFYHEPITAAASAAFAGLPAGSLLDRWRDEADAGERMKLAGQVQELIKNGPPAAADHPDAVLHRQLTALSGPLLGALDFGQLATATGQARSAPSTYGIEPGLFGRHPSGKVLPAGSFVTEAPSVVEIRLPADLVGGREFVVTAAVDRHAGPQAAVQAQVLVDQPPAAARMLAGSPVLVRKGSPAEARIVQSFEDFRRIFPAALCYGQIVPVDEVVTVVLFHREDEPLMRLMLDDAEQRRLDRLWDELRFVSQDALKVEEAYVQFMEYVTQDGDVRIFEPLRKPIKDRADAFRARLLAAEAQQIDALVDFADRAYRRPLSADEQSGLRQLYGQLRKQDLDHEAAFRLTLARILVAPSFLYRSEPPAGSAEPKPVSDWELASRLSYFLWSTMPDAELRQLAAAGKLHEPEVLKSQARRMLQDPKARALATEFGCQWIDIRGFDTHNEKSEQVFPEFAALRGPMYEESVRFFMDLFARDGSILDVVNADHTFVNDALAKFYELPGIEGPEFRRVDGVQAHHRGGVLGMATLLAKQSGASRTSPILRGNWLIETFLGEKLPKPPKNVPLLPESELGTDGLTVRQITEAHSSIESCAKCHRKIDPFGFALEGFDAIGRRRTKDLAGRAIETQVETPDGVKFGDIEGLRAYILTHRRDDFLHHFSRKLLGYALGRGVQLSDEPLLQEMQRKLQENDYRFSAALDAILDSRQFRQTRGIETPLEEVGAR